MTAINWKNGVNGDWSLNTNWNPATVPGSGDAVTIAAASAVPYTVTITVPEAASTLTLNQKNATVADQATLTMGGALTLTAGAFDLQAAGTIKGGALVMNGGTLLTDGGTLDGVKVQGVLNLTQSFGSIRIQDGLTLTDKAGTGGGLLNLTGLGMVLNFASGVQTLNSAVAGKASTVNIGSSSGDTINEQSAVGTVTTLNFGSLVSVMQIGQSATLNASSQAGDSMVNLGTIGAILGGGHFDINGGAFVNKGLINVNNGDALTISASNFSNSGTVNVINGSTLNIGQGGSWSSTGKISVTDSTVNLLGTVTQAELNSITRAGGLVDLAGTMDLAGGTLNVGGTTAIGGLLLTGTIANGTVHDGGLGLQFGTGFSPPPTLDGVIYQGAVDLSEASARLTVLDAFTVTGTSGTGPGTINLTGNNSNLTLTGSRTLDNATVRIGNASLSIANPGSTTAVTFGPNLTIKQGGVGPFFFSGVNSSISGSFSLSDSLLNQGSIFGSLQNAALTISSFGTFTNAGTIAFSNGDNLGISADTVTNQSSITLGNGVVASFTGTSSLNNQGVVSAGSGDSISISAATITNPGTMLIGSGSTLGISGFTSFANTGSLNLAAGATLNIGSFNAPWSSTGKITATNATVNLNGVVTQGQIAAITRVGGVIDIAGTLNNTGTTLNVGTGSPFGALVLTGTIAGGIIHDAGSGLTFGNGASFGNAPVLDGVAYRGVLDLSETNAQLAVLDGIVLTGTAGTGAGTVNLTGAGSELIVGSSSSSSTSQVLNNATVNIGAASSSSFFSAAATLAAQSSFFGGGPTLLTLGPGLRLQHVGQFAALAGPTNAGDMLINRGTIGAILNGGSFTVTGNQFSNLGLINIANGDSLSIQSSSFTNAGTVNVQTGGTLAVGSGGDWISTGAIKETGATVVLNGDVTLPEINSITRSGGTIVIAGRFDNQSSTLKVGTGSKLGNFVLSGTIDNGIVNDAGGGLVMHGGTLDTVAYQGLIDLSASGAALTVLGKLTATDVTGTKAGTIKLTGAGSVLTLQEPQTLDNATISIGSTGGDTIAVTSAFFGGASWTTTLGTKLNIQQTGLSAALSGITNTVDILANAGTIAAGVSGGIFNISGDNFANSGSITVSNKDTLNLAAGNISNTGTVNVISGGILNLGTQSFFGPPAIFSNTGVLSETNGTINLIGPVTLQNLNSITRSGGTIAVAGTADLGGGTLNVGTGSKLGALVVTGTIQNGTIHDADPGLIFTNGTGLTGGTLNNVKYDGTLDLSQAKANAILASAVTFAGLNGTGQGTILLTGPSSSLTTQGTFLLDNAKLALGGATLNAASTAVQFVTIPALLTLGKNLSITHTLSSDSTTGFSSIASQDGSFGQAGSIISQGSITAGLKGGTLNIAGGGFTNQGGISVSNGDSVSVTASSFSNGGSVSVNGGVVTIGSANSFSPSLFSNTGSVTVTGGGTLNLGSSSAGTPFSWTSSGLLSETGGAINLNGPVTLANLNSITRSGGAVTLAGTFDNGNSATALGVGTGSKLGALVLTGSIANATVNDAGAGIAFQGFQSTLNHVTYQGTMDLSAASSTVTVLNGLTLKGLNGSGAAKVLLTGTGSTMSVAGTQTLDNALLDIGGGASLLAIATTGSVAAGPAQLTLGSKLNVVHTGGNATIGSGFSGFGNSANTIINQGSISAMVTGGALTIGSNSGAGLIFKNQGMINVGAADTLSILASTFTNSGSVNVTTGGVLNLGQLFSASTWSSTGAITETGATINLFGTTTIASMNKITRSGGTVNFQGTLTGAGGTLNVGTGTALGLLQNTGTINSTIVHDAGKGMWFFGPPHASGGGGAVFNGVTYQGMLDLSPSQSNLTVAGGFTLTNLAGTGAGVANLTGAASVLFASGTETLDNFTLNMGNGEALGSTLFQTDPGALGTTLTLGSKLTINQVGAFVNVVGARNLGDKMVNGGKIVANYAGGHFLITEGSFVNNGFIIVGNGDTLTLDPDQLTNTGSLVINKAGTLRVDGALAGGSVTFSDKSSGTLMLGTPGSVTTKMVGFGATDATHSDAIDLLNTVATKLSYSGTASSGVLTVTNAAAATVATLNFTGNYTTASFHLASDGNGGTLILDPPVNANTVGAPAMQFVAGSPVVDASAGNQTLTLTGASRPETITGFGLSNGDVLDLHKLLAGCAWNGDASTIANFVGISANDGNTTISVDPSGHGDGSVVATLAGIDTSLGELAAHGAIRFGWGGG